MSCFIPCHISLQPQYYQWVLRCKPERSPYPLPLLQAILPYYTEPQLRFLIDSVFIGISFYFAVVHCVPTRLLQPDYTNISGPRSGCNPSPARRLGDFCAAVRVLRRGRRPPLGPRVRFWARKRQINTVQLSGALTVIRLDGFRSLECLFASLNPWATVSVNIHAPVISRLLKNSDRRIARARGMLGYRWWNSSCWQSLLTH